MNARDYTDEDDLSRGRGDPDAYGYPGEPKYIGIDKPVVERRNFYDGWGKKEAYANRWMLPEELQDQIDYDPRFDEDLDDTE